MKISLLLTLVVSALTSLQAAPNGIMARLDILLRDDIEVKVLNISSGGKVTESAWGDSRTLVSLFPATTTWKSASLTIQSNQDGRVTLMPMSDKIKNEPPAFIRYDAMRSSDESLQNGNFESSGENGAPRWWSASDAEGEEPEARASVVEGGALEGNRSIRVWHDSKYAQSISLQAGVPVTISFSYRAEKPSEAEAAKNN